MGNPAKERDGAQHQHYVPKFILRNFLSNPKKEQVSVFDKQTGKTFTPSIDGIMGERRFNDFRISDEYIASFENAAGRIEDMVLPTYRRVVANRRLDKTPQEQADLALFVAFQFLRTRALRDTFAELDQLLDAKLKETGGGIDQIDGWQPLSDDRLKHQHATFMFKYIKEFVAIIAEKDFLLIAAPKGRSFYLSDNPVNLYNAEPVSDFRSNLGLSVKGIQIFAPLSSDLMLACFCPSIMASIRASEKENEGVAEAALLSRVLMGHITPSDMRAKLDELAAMRVPVDRMIRCVETGQPHECDEDNMDFNNWLQLEYSKRFVICQNSDFKLARQFTKEHPKGLAPRMGIV